MAFIIKARVLAYNLFIHGEKGMVYVLYAFVFPIIEIWPFKIKQIINLIYLLFSVNQ